MKHNGLTDIRSDFISHNSRPADSSAAFHTKTTITYTMGNKFLVRKSFKLSGDRGLAL